MPHSFQHFLLIVNTISKPIVVWVIGGCRNEDSHGMCEFGLNVANTIILSTTSFKHKKIFFNRLADNANYSDWDEYQRQCQDHGQHC